MVVMADPLVEAAVHWYADYAEPRPGRSPSPSSPSAATTVVTPRTAAFPELVERLARRPADRIELLVSDAG